MKATLQSLYDEHGIKEKAKATHITRYYKVKKCKIRIGDKRLDGYEIISAIWYALTHIFANFVLNK